LWAEQLGATLSGVSVQNGELREGSRARMSIARRDDFLKEEDRRQIYDFLREPTWEYCWKSGPDRDEFSFWHKHFAGAVESDHAAGNKEVPSQDRGAELARNAPLLHRFWLTQTRTVLPGHRLGRFDIHRSHMIDAAR
jgi:SM-20-related protein